ncbi:hypothetical protein EES39_39800 [Streptomyces sp. ADI92-24]|nr:hypothetical protein EDD95_6074 [Streptomyces sp. CEV 2-1]RPK31960.1 hypothetical protein EES39_39800 [Streptomyces sp. ADI92-24]
MAQAWEDVALPATGRSCDQGLAGSPPTASPT